MKKDILYKYMKLMYKDKIVFLKSGTFYHTFNEDAIILSSIFNYQVINNRASTPISNKDKIKDKLNKLKIDVVFVNDENNIEENVNDDNNYENYLNEVREKEGFDKKVNYLTGLIESKLKEDENNYDKLLNYIESL